jgi:monoamine oxidase
VIVAFLCLWIGCAPVSTQSTAIIPGAPLLDTSAAASSVDTAATDAGTRRAAVAVIGAGLSGLVTAWELKRLGVDVVILEARTRVGGQVVHQALSPDDTLAEGGAQWLHNEHLATVELAKTLGIGTRHQAFVGDWVVSGDEVEFRADPRPAGEGGTEYGKAVAALEALAKGVSAEAPQDHPSATGLDDQSLAEWLEVQLIGEGAESAQRGFDRDCERAFGGKPTQISLLWTLSRIAAAGTYEALTRSPLETRVEGGAARIAEALAKALGDRIVLSSPVAGVDQTSPDEVIVESALLRVVAERVVVAMSPSAAGRLTYVPAVSLERAGLMAYWPEAGAPYKINITYETPFWRDDGHSGWAISGGTPILRTEDSSPAQGPGLLSVVVEPSEMPALVWQRHDLILDQLASLFGDRAHTPLDFREQDWSTDEWGGSSTAVAPGLISTYGSALRPPFDRIHWTGSDTSASWTGTLEGAVLSGQRAASEVYATLSD